MRLNRSMKAFCTGVPGWMSYRAIPPGIGRNHPLEGLDHGRVPRGGVHRRGIPRRPGQSGDAAGATDREPMLCRHYLDGLTTRGRRYRVRLRTSLMAAFSSASSVTGHPIIPIRGH